MPCTGMQVLSSHTQDTDHRLLQCGRNPERSPVLPHPSYSSTAFNHIYHLIPPSCFLSASICAQSLKVAPFDRITLKWLLPTPLTPHLQPIPSVWQDIWQGNIQSNRYCLLLALLIPQRIPGVGPKEKLIFISLF